MDKKTLNVRLTWRLEGYDPCHREYYLLDGMYQDAQAAHQAAQYRLNSLEILQPSILSGGQLPDGIQDHVYVVPPESYKYRFTGLCPRCKKEMKAYLGARFCGAACSQSFEMRDRGAA